MGNLAMDSELSTKLSVIAQPGLPSESSSVRGRYWRRYHANQKLAPTHTSKS
jgi:hypothetical protein